MDLVQFFGRFHVLVLHLPIGILLMAAVIEAYNTVRGNPRATTLNTVWLWGFISAVGASCLGYMLSLGGGYDPDSVAVHRTWGIATALCSLICWLLFRSRLGLAKPIILSLCIMQLLILFSTGHYGANMTHGPTYLFEYAPNSIRLMAGLPAHEKPRPMVTTIEQADAYLDIIKPALKKRCTSCHNPNKLKGKLDLSEYAAILKGGESGPAVSAKSLEKSELYQRITLDDHDEKYMPADGKIPLTEQQVAAIKWWINAGAPEQGTIKQLNVKAEDKNILAQALGLAASPGDWPLKPIAALPQAKRVKLEKYGFIVKKIASDVNYIDVDFSSSSQALSDTAIEALLDAQEHIVWLNLSNREINDEHLPFLSKLGNLIKIRLEKNPITSDGIKNLAALPHLMYLNLHSTAVDDQVFSSLQQIKTLQSVFLTMTAVSADGLAQFSKETRGVVAISARRTI